MYYLLYKASLTIIIYKVRIINTLTRLCGLLNTHVKCGMCCNNVATVGPIGQIELCFEKKDNAFGMEKHERAVLNTETLITVKNLYLSSKI